jgi:hypothetical protein
VVEGELKETFVSENHEVIEADACEIYCANIQIPYSEKGLDIDLDKFSKDIRKRLPMNTIEVALVGPKIFELEVLRDTGASADFINREIVDKWLSENLLKPGWFKKIDPITVRFANGSHESIDTLLAIGVGVKDKFETIGL